MPGIGVLKNPGRGVVDSVEHSRVALRRGGLEKQVAGLREYLAAARTRAWRIRADRRVQRCSQQRRRHSLARNIRQQQPEFSVAERQEIVVIATDASGGPANPRVIQSLRVGENLRKQRLLYLFRHLQ